MKKIKKFLSQNIYAQLFIEFLTLGLFTIGGGLAMIGLVKERMCDKRNWLTEDETLDAIAVSQGLPGVIAINMSVFVGYKVGKIKGALISCFAMLLPSFLIILGIATFLQGTYHNPYVKGALRGISAAVAGIIIMTCYKMGKQLFQKDKEYKGIVVFNILVMVFTFAAITFFKIDVSWMILTSIVLGIVFFNLVINRAKRGEGK